MMNDPVIARVWDHAGSKGQETMENFVQAPKVSNPTATQNFYDMMTGQNGETLRGITGAQLAQITAGMSQADRRQAQSIAAKMNSTSGPQLEQQFKSVDAEFKRQALAAGLIRNAPNSNQLVPEDQPVYQQLRQEILNDPNSVEPMSPQQRMNYVATFVADKKANQSFNGAEARRTFNGTTQKTSPVGAQTVLAPNNAGGSNAPPVKGAAAWFSGAAAATRAYWNQQYRKTYGQAPSNPQELYNFIDKNSGK
jgi:hypothetical protein